MLTYRKRDERSLLVAGRLRWTTTLCAIVFIHRIKFSNFINSKIRSGDYYTPAPFVYFSTYSFSYLRTGLRAANVSSSRFTTVLCGAVCTTSGDSSTSFAI